MRSSTFAWLCEIKNATGAIYIFLEHFAWLCEIFAWSCEISFEISLWFVAKNVFLSISHDHAKWKYIIFHSFFSFLPFFSFESTSITSKSHSKPIALLFSLCIWIFINFICSLQFDSSLLSPIYQNHTL